MRKLNDTSKICTFLCIVLCVGSLSGCGAAMQFLADGTDAVLNGLADGTNIVMNGLADGTEQILSDLSEADDGQAKDSILKAFGELVGDAGTAALTPQSKLQGHKENGADDYTGAYEATYSEFTGTEIFIWWDYAGARSGKYDPHHLFTFSRKRRSSSFSSLRGR